MAGLDIKGLSISIQSSPTCQSPLPITSSIIFKSQTISGTDNRHTQSVPDPARTDDNKHEAC